MGITAYTVETVEEISWSTPLKILLRPKQAWLVTMIEGENQSHMFAITDLKHSFGVYVYILYYTLIVNVYLFSLIRL